MGLPLKDTLWVGAYCVANIANNSRASLLLCAISSLAESVLGYCAAEAYVLKKAGADGLPKSHTKQRVL